MIMGETYEDPDVEILSFLCTCSAWQGYVGEYSKDSNELLFQFCGSLLMSSKIYIGAIW